MSKYFYYFLFIATAISCVRQPEVDPSKDFCTPESYQFVTTSDCPSAERLDSTALFILEGHGTSDTIIVAVNGGPFVELGTDWLNYYEQIKDIAYVRQPQTLQGFSQGDENIPNAWEGADVDISKAAAMLNESILHFKQQGKKVIVIGGSWGAFVTQQWLSEYETRVDRVFILVGRIHAQNLNNSFFPAYPAETRAYLRAQSNKDYRPLLAGKDLSNIYYLTATNDINVFPLNVEEIDWLNENNVKHYEVVGNHYVMTERKGTLLLIDLMFRH